MQNHQFIEDNIIMLSKQTMDLFLKEKNAVELIALYSFYYYTAKWQKTNQPKATISYVAKALHWSQDKVRRIKKKLIELGLIEDARSVNTETGHVTGWYIKLNYIWKESTLPQTPEGGVNHHVESTPTNALSEITKNASNVNSLNALGESKTRIVSDPISDVPRALEHWRITFGKAPPGTKERTWFPLQRLIEAYGIDHVLEAITAVRQSLGDRYAPSINNPLDLENKWLQLIKPYHDRKVYKEVPSV